MERPKTEFEKLMEKSIEDKFGLDKKTFSPREIEERDKYQAAITRNKAYIASNYSAKQ